MCRVRAAEQRSQVVSATARVREAGTRAHPVGESSAAAKGNLGRATGAIGPPGKDSVQSRFVVLLFSPFVLFPIIIFKFKFELGSSLTQTSKMHQISTSTCVCRNISFIFTVFINILTYLVNGRNIPLRKIFL
jgi:hypothetical protein